MSITQRKRGISIDISKQIHRCDGFTLSTIYKNEYVKHRYIGYSDKDARYLFRRYVEEQTRKKQ